MTRTILISEKNQIQILPINKVHEDSFSITKIEGIDFEKLQDKLTAQESNMIAPIVVRPDWKDWWLVVDWRRRLMAMKAWGLTEVHAIVKNLSDKDARIEAIKLNRARGEFDQIKLAQLIKELKTEFHMNNLDLQEELGYEPEEIYALEVLADIDADDEIDEEKEMQELEDNIWVLDDNEVQPNLYDKITIEVSQEEMAKIVSLATKTWLTKEKAIYASIAMMKDESR